ncbi:MAG: hypothetical protein B6244_04125 [Candidatus Cloacimonetes bacterium 4572_55]|nr:MAG: hypothetical protein B6244_04125 [Candidatus Cloacimonetes bacterium 4572_55]
MNIREEFPFTPILGWSITRYGTFKMCKRKYFYTYYPKFDPDYSSFKVLKLKKMTTKPLEIGNIVHDMMRDLLKRLQRTTKEINRDRFFKYALEKTETYCQRKTFAEVYYNETDKIEARDLIDAINALLTAFLESDRLKWLIEFAAPEKDLWQIESAGYGETRINDLKAYCKVDFLFPVQDRLYIIDWKTGKGNLGKHTRQLEGYAFWAHSHHNWDIEKIMPIIAYLSPEYSEIPIRMYPSYLQTFPESVKKETQEMYEYCRNIKYNIPKDKDIFFAISHTKICDHCNFREFCSSP